MSHRHLAIDQSGNEVLPFDTMDGASQIDWSHPMTKDLHSAYVTTERHIRDAAGFIPPSLITLSGSTSAVDNTTEGRALVFDGSNSNQINLAIDNTTFEFQNGSNFLTWFYLVRYDGGATDVNEHTLSSNVGNFNNDNTVIADIGTDFEDGEFHTVCVTRDTSNMYVYFDTVQVGTNTVTANWQYTHLIRYDANQNDLEVSIGDNVNKTDMQLCGTPQKVSDRFEGAVKFIGLWHRQLQPYEILALHSDWRQLFVQTDYMMPAPGAAPAAGAPTGALYGPLAGPLAGPV